MWLAASASTTHAVLWIRSCGLTLPPVLILQCRSDAMSHGMLLSALLAAALLAAAGARPSGGRALLGKAKGFCNSCSSNYDPECGTDGQTYGNACVRTCANVGLEKRGRCDNCKLRRSELGGRGLRLLWVSARAIPSAQPGAACPEAGAAAPRSNP